MKKRRPSSPPAASPYAFERLESRLPMAGDTYLVNFQLDTTPPPQRYLVDSGQVFGLRASGQTYGWSTDHTDQARTRIDPETGNPLNPDIRLSTLVHIEAGQRWEFQLPNGSYEVTVAVGDPATTDGVHTINVEGVNYWNAVSDVGVTTLVKTMTVNVADGRLTLDQGAAADKATRINYVQIVGLAGAPNQSPDAPLVTEPLFDGKIVNPADVHMEAINFQDGDGNLHKSTDWEIWTTGPSAELVWETRGIEGVERLHTHLGDGIFVNSRAGTRTLSENTDHELRVRFRDDAGSVSAYSTRLFRTGSANASFPLLLERVLDTPAPTWVDIFGATIDLPDGSSFVSPSDPILAIDLDGGSSFPVNESPNLAIDGTLAKYLNFGEVNSGFILTPSGSSRVVTGFRLTTANDSEERDPSQWALWGTNDSISSTQNSTGTAENWSLIAQGSVSLPAARNTVGPLVSFANSTAYKSYRMVFTGVKNTAAANSMQIGEIGFVTTGGVAGGPASLEISGADFATTLLDIEGQTAAGNALTFAPGQGITVESRVKIRSGGSSLVLRESNLTAVNDRGETFTIYLPAINLAAGQRLDLWVSSNGSTYFGTASQTQPNFQSLARAAAIDVPYFANKSGFLIEEVGDGYRLPVNIAFVPNPGPNPSDPLYFVTELYGSIQVVSRDGTKREFATGLLDYNPQGPISGSGEQGLTGIAVERDATNPDIYNLYVGMLWDNGAAPGGASHYPKVEKLTSVPGGLALGTRTVLLNMQPETQGQSHQISNISIGPDGMLYVHNGDGFDAGTAQNLDQFRGKVLRMTKTGAAPADNPFYNASNGITARDYVWAYGLRNPFGGAWRAADGKHYSVENGPSVDRFAQINRGVNYGYDGSDQSMTIGALYNWVPSTAPVNIAFVQPETFGGSQFPQSLQDRAFVSESGPTYAGGPQSQGKKVTQFTLGPTGALVSGPTNFAEYFGAGQSTVVALAAGPDGLYFSEFYEETGASGPTAAGSRIFRIRYVNPLAGDYDINGVVDQGDLTVWRNNFGSNLLLAADGNRDGVVDAADYTVWRDNLGATLPAVAPATAPATALAAAVDSSDTALAVEAIDKAFPGLLLSGGPLLKFSASGVSPAIPVSGPEAIDRALLLLNAELQGDADPRNTDATAPSASVGSVDSGFALLDEKPEPSEKVAPSFGFLGAQLLRSLETGD